MILCAITSVCNSMPIQRLCLSVRVTEVQALIHTFDLCLHGNNRSISDIKLTLQNIKTKQYCKGLDAFSSMAYVGMSELG